MADVLLYLVMYLMCEEFEHFELADAAVRVPIIHHPHELTHSLTYSLFDTPRAEVIL